MKIKQLPEDFLVEEHIELPGESGAYAYYRVEKKGVPTLVVRDEMAAQLKVTPSALFFPALKDTTAVAVQYVSVRSQGPEKLKGKGFVAERVLWGPRALRSKDLLGNRFTVIIRDLSKEEAQACAEAAPQLQDCGLPNYFDDQCFGSLSEDGFIGKAILTRDAEKVVRIYLSELMVGDTQIIREFKSLVKSHWGQWGYLLHQAPRPSNFRSVITFLKDHPHDYRKAANLIQDRLLSVYLSAYQAWIWNHILAHYLEQKESVSTKIEIAGDSFSLPIFKDEDLAAICKLEVDLPRLTARYEGDLSGSAAAVFEQEGLTIRDFKARILRRVYLIKGERLVWFSPTEVELDEVQPDEHEKDRFAVMLSFTLQPGSYATLVLKALAARLGTKIRASE